MRTSKMQVTLLTTDELAARIRYNARYIRRHLVDYKLIEGIHYTRPFGGKKLLFIWERIESEILAPLVEQPMFSKGA